MAAQSRSVIRSACPAPASPARRHSNSPSATRSWRSPPCASASARASPSPLSGSEMETGGQTWATGLWSDREIADCFSDTALFASFSRFERALTKGLAEAGLIEPSDAAQIIEQIAGFQPDAAAIAEAGISDGVPVPEYVRQLRAHVSGPAKAMLDRKSVV